MKVNKTYVLGAFVMTMSTIWSSDDGMICKNGVCTFDPSKVSASQYEITKEVKQNTIIELTQENFESVVKNSTKPVIIDFYATWCQPCKVMKPIFDELAEQENGYVFAAIEGDKNPTISAQCSVRAFPSFVIFKNGVQWGKIEGGMAKEQLLAEFKKILDLNQPMIASQSERLMELLMAINERNLDAIKKAIATGVDVKGTLETPQGNLSALSVAVITGSNEIIDLLIDSGAKIDKALEESIKIQIDNSQALTEVLQQNFDYCKNKISTLPKPIVQNVVLSSPELGMQFVQAFGNQEELKKLIDQGADVNIAFLLGKSQTTPLCMAMLLNNKIVMDILIDAGATFTTEIINDKGNKQSMLEAIQSDLDTYRLGVTKSRERLAYAANKIK